MKILNLIVDSLFILEQFPERNKEITNFIWNAEPGSKNIPGFVAT